MNMEEMASADRAILVRSATITTFYVDEQERTFPINKPDIMESDSRILIDPNLESSATSSLPPLHHLLSSEMDIAKIFW